MITLATTMTMIIAIARPLKTTISTAQQYHIMCALDALAFSRSAGSQKAPKAWICSEHGRALWLVRLRVGS